MADSIECVSHVIKTYTRQVPGGPCVYLTEFDIFDASLFLDCTPQIIEDPEKVQHCSTAIVGETSVVFSKARISETLWQYELSFSQGDSPTRARIIAAMEKELGKQFRQGQWNKVDQMGTNHEIDGHIWQVYVV